MSAGGKQTDRWKFMRPLYEQPVPPLHLVLMVVLLAQRKRGRLIETEIARIASPAREFGEFMNQRWTDSDDREARMTALTEQMAAMTATMLRLQIATVVLAVLSVAAAVIAISLA